MTKYLSQQNWIWRGNCGSFGIGALPDTRWLKLHIISDYGIAEIAATNFIQWTSKIYVIIHLRMSYRMCARGGPRFIRRLNCELQDPLGLNFILKLKLTSRFWPPMHLALSAKISPLHAVVEDTFCKVLKFNHNHRAILKKWEVICLLEVPNMKGGCVYTKGVHIGSVSTYGGQTPECRI
jgi:hypothetical protein